MDLANGPVVEKGNFKYRDKNQPVEKRVKDLLGRNAEEKTAEGRVYVSGGNISS